MQYLSTRDGWGLLPRALHWSIALLVTVQIVIGIRIGLLDMYDPIDVEWYKNTIPLHKSIGLTILVLMLARVAVRRLGVTPSLPATTRPWQARAARVTHGALYGLLILQPVLGYLQSAAYGATTRYFGLFVVPNVLPDAWQRPQSDALRLAAQNGHRIVAWLIAGLLIVHVLGALKHHFLDRDGVLVRMVKGTPAIDGPAQRPSRETV